MGGGILARATSNGAFVSSWYTAQAQKNSGSTNSIRSDQVTCVIVGASTSPVARRWRPSTSPTAIAAKTRMRLPVATVVAVYTRVETTTGRCPVAAAKTAPRKKISSATPFATATNVAAVTAAPPAYWRRSAHEVVRGRVVRRAQL